MLDHNAGTETQVNFSEAASVELAEAPTAEQTPVRVIRHMDDAKFRICLEKVMTTHRRLLAKLAE